MNLLNALTGLYGKLHNYPCVPFWVLTPFRKATRGLANAFLPYYLSKLHKKRQLNGKDVIISFTSFPARINDVWKVVESLKSQTVKPERIILWLSREQFPIVESIPQSLRECEDELFEIRMVDDDIRSHKKYYYVIREYPDKTFVTCDDDVYYHPRMLESLIKSSRMFPGCICANVTSQMSFNENGELLPYLQWKCDKKPYSSENNVQIGIGGVLYPPHCLYDKVLNKDLFWKLAPMADDLWLSLMARLNNTPVVQTPHNLLPLPVEIDAPSLSSINNGVENMNDQQIRQMREWLKTEKLPDVYASEYKVKFEKGVFNDM